MDNTQEIINSEKTEQPEKKQSHFLSKLMLGMIIVFAGLFGSFWILFKNASDAFQKNKTIESDSVYQSIYEKSYQFGEAEYHRSERAVLSLGNIREVSDLEVLSIYDEAVVTTGDYLFLVPGKGFFTVNLSKAEFLLDHERKTVIVKLPEPEINNPVRIDYASENMKYFKLGKNGIWEKLNNGSISEGVNMVQKTIIPQAQSMIRQNLESNQGYIRMAENSAKNLLTGMIRTVNSDVKDLNIIIDFF